MYQEIFVCMQKKKKLYPFSSTDVGFSVQPSFRVSPRLHPHHLPEGEKNSTYLHYYIKQENMANENSAGPTLAQEKPTPAYKGNNQTTHVQFIWREKTIAKGKPNVRSA